MELKILERDKREGVSYICDGDEEYDMVTGRLLTYEGEHYGWYSVTRTPDSEQIIDYTDPNTFETEKRLCAEFILRRMKTDETQWQYTSVWVPVKGVDKETNNAFERAMGVLDEFR